MSELAFNIALSHSLLSSSTLISLVEYFGSAQAVWHAPTYVLQKYLKDEQIEKICKTREQVEPEELLMQYQNAGVSVLTSSDSSYPPLLRFIHDPPFLLYVKGNPKALLHCPTLSIVGTRRCSTYGLQVVEQLVNEVAGSFPSIISGLAYGIDTMAHKCALNCNLPTVAVFGTGIDQIYPRENRHLAQQIVESGGALLSELPRSVPGNYYNFPRRNRIIAGISQTTLVVEGNERSGALITARYALEENRQVMAVPGNISNPNATGPNRMIQQGAMPVLCGQDIIETMGWKSVSQISDNGSTLDKPELFNQLSSFEQEILSIIGYEPVKLEAIQYKTKETPIGQINTALTMLEINGLITSLPGAKFCRN